MNIGLILIMFLLINNCNFIVSSDKSVSLDSSTIDSDSLKEGLQDKKFIKDLLNDPNFLNSSKEKDKFDLYLHNKNYTEDQKCQIKDYYKDFVYNKKEEYLTDAFAVSIPTIISSITTVGFCILNQAMTPEALGFSVGTSSLITLVGTVYVVKKSLKVIDYKKIIKNMDFESEKYDIV